MAEKSAGVLEPGQPGFLPLDDLGAPSGDPTLVPPDTGEFANVVGAPLNDPQDYLTPTGAPIPDTLNPAITMFDDAYLERNPPVPPS